MRSLKLTTSVSTQPAQRMQLQYLSLHILSLLKHWLAHLPLKHFPISINPIIWKVDLQTTYLTLFLKGIHSRNAACQFKRICIGPTNIYTILTILGNPSACFLTDWLPYAAQKWKDPSNVDYWLFWCWLFNELYFVKVMSILIQIVFILNFHNPASVRIFILVLHWWFLSCIILSLIFFILVF